MKKILFQGDSITSARRYPEDGNFRGSGYATLVSAQLGYERPNEFEFVNMGIGGDRITYLLARMKCDFINFKPEYLSILIGINDAWLDVAQNNGVSAERFEMFYNILIEDVKKALPDVKIMILEPFVLKSEFNAEVWDAFRCETEKRAIAAKNVAEKNGLVFVPLMKTFDDMTKIAPNDYWSFDGIHPTAAGHEIIKRVWLEGFKKLEK